MSEVRFIRNATDADAQMVGNESAHIVGGKDLFDSRCLLGRCQAVDGHDEPPNRRLRWACDQAIRPAMWRCVKILRVLQQHHSSSKPPRGCSKSKAGNPRRSEGTEGPQGFGRHCATITTQRGNSFKGSVSNCGGAGYAGSSG